MKAYVCHLGMIAVVRIPVRRVLLIDIPGNKT